MLQLNQVLISDDRCRGLDPSQHITHILSYSYLINSSCDVVSPLDSSRGINRAEVISIVWVCVGSWERGTHTARPALIGQSHGQGEPPISTTSDLWLWFEQNDLYPPPESTYDRICRRALLSMLLIRQESDIPRKYSQDCYFSIPEILI